jgi:hypothetical protein
MDYDIKSQKKGVHKAKSRLKLHDKGHRFKTLTHKKKASRLKKIKKSAELLQKKGKTKGR